MGEEKLLLGIFPIAGFIALGFIVGIVFGVFVISSSDSTFFVANSDRKNLEIEQTLSNLANQRPMTFVDTVSAQQYVNGTIKEIEFESGVTFMAGNNLDDPQDQIQVGTRLQLTTMQFDPVCNFTLIDNSTAENQTKPILDYLISNKYNFELITNDVCDPKNIITHLLNWQLFG